MTDLKWLFVDMNSFFASCEQQEREELRGKPVVIAPVNTDATCAIAASYEAKAFGIRTGTNIGLARRLCPHLEVVHCRHEVYGEYHRQIMRLFKTISPDIRKLSVDEMACPISSDLANTDAAALKFAQRLKESMRREVGDHMLCSVGLAPNVFLAKVATELHKPDGLVVLHKSDLPEALCRLELRDFPGIGRRMLDRLNRCGITNVAEMYAADPWLLRIAWGGVLGERWWHMIRGSTECDYAALIERDPKSVGHSHVLPPEMRNTVSAEGVLLRLTARAVRRLRLKGLHARSIQVYMKHVARGWNAGGVCVWSAVSQRRTAAADPFTWVAAARELWETRPEFVRERVPMQVGVVFTDVLPSVGVTLPLFDRERQNEAAARAMDSVLHKFGKNAIEIGSVLLHREGTREAVAFGKITDDAREEQLLSAHEIKHGMSLRLEPGENHLLRI